MTKCAECKTKVIHYHGNPFCKECGKNFYEGEKDELQIKVSDRRAQNILAH